jgi:hypothetical protein
VRETYILSSREFSMPLLPVFLLKRAKKQKEKKGHFRKDERTNWFSLIVYIIFDEQQRENFQLSFTLIGTAVVFLYFLLHQ